MVEIMCSNIFFFYYAEEWIQRYVMNQWKMLQISGVWSFSTQLINQLNVPLQRRRLYHYYPSISRILKPSFQKSMDPSLIQHFSNSFRKKKLIFDFLNVLQKKMWFMYFFFKTGTRLLLIHLVIWVDRFDCCICVKKSPTFQNICNKVEVLAMRWFFNFNSPRLIYGW